MTALQASVRTSPLARERAWFLLAWVVPLAIAGLVSFAQPILGDGDTFWHIAAGRWMLSHLQVPSVDPFSFSYAGRPWDAQEWLSEVLMAGTFQLAGWSGIMLLTGLAIGATAALMTRWLLKFLSPLTTGATLTVGLACVAPSLLARPHIIALPVLALWTIALLEARRRGRAPGLALLTVMGVWANLHSSFIVGIGLAGALALEALLDFRAWRTRTVLGWFGFCLACVVVAMATPRGVEGLAFPLKVMSMKSLPGISEWLGPNFLTLQPMEVALLAGVFALFWRGVRLTAVRAALALLLVHMTLQHVRQEVLLGVIVPLLIAEPLGAALGPSMMVTPQRLGAPQTALAAGLFAALALGRLLSPETRVDGETAPITALAHVPPALARQPVINGYDFGGYLIFSGVRPFIDGRADMYGDDFIANYDQIVAGNQAAFNAAASYYGVRWTILAPGQPLVGVLDRTPGWRRLYADRFAIVQEKTGP